MEVTWEDCRRIVRIADRIINDLEYLNHAEREYYEMIAKEFNDERKTMD